MLDKIESILRDQCKLVISRPILVGVSGGPDSLCLTEIFRGAGYRLVIAHFNHKLRPESDAEADEVEKTAARLMIPCVVESADVRLYAAVEKLSIEEAARDLRYRFLFAQARRHEAQAVAVGHTADDQVETVLMHFIRGAGLAGLRGMSYRTFLPTFDATIPLVRPLLDVWREETVAYCASHDLNPHYDASNESFDFLRNRLRHALIPALQTYNPRFRQAVWRSVQSLSSDYALLNEALDVGWEKCVIQETGEYVAFDLSSLSTYSDGLQRHLVRRAVERLLPGEETVYAVLERATAFIADPARVRMDLTGGLMLFREGQTLYLVKPEAQLPFDHWPQMPGQSDSILFTLPGQVDLSGGWCFSSERWHAPESAWEKASRNEDLFQVWLDAEELPNQMELRVKRPGDVFEPMGLQGHSQKLADFLTNVKLPQRARNRWPLLCAGEKVIWVPGYRPAESFRLRETSRRVAYFALRRVPGRSS
jgi:tRNA(Ile)-lysidine synthase